MSLKLNTASGGSITLQEADTASNLTITVPATTGTIALTSQLPVAGPAFSAYAGTTTTLTSATDTKIIFDTELFDTNSNYASSRFTPTVAGYYQVNACASMNYWNGIIYNVIIYKNGSAYQNGQTAYPQTVGGVRASISSIVYCNGSTDYIEIYGWQYAQSSNNVVSASQTSTWFNASLIRAA
jgi:hypothetical protein